MSQVYPVTCIRDTCMDIGIDLTSLLSVVYRCRFTQKLSNVPISAYN